MPLLKFRISWNEDESIYRNIEIQSNQSFFEFHTAIKKYFELPIDMEALFYVTNSRGHILKTLSSIVEKNLRDAPASRMKRTPIGALVQDPEQTFTYDCAHPKALQFFIEIITINPSNDSNTTQYPICTKSEGISPIHFGVKIENDPISDILNQFESIADDEDFDNEDIDEFDNEQTDE